MAEEEKKDAGEEKEKKSLAKVESEAKEKDTKETAEGESSGATEPEEKKEEGGKEATSNETKTEEGSAESEKGKGDDSKTEGEVSDETEKADEEEEKSGEEAQTEEKKGKRKFGFLFGGKKADKKEAGEEKKAGDEKMGGEVAELIKEFQVASEIENKLDEKSDYLVLKIRKSVVMMILGMLVLAMWAVPLSKGVRLYLSEKGVSVAWPFSKSETVEEATESAELAEEGPRIRIRDSSGDEEGVRKVADLLEGAGFVMVEIQSDSENEYDGVGLIVKPGSEELRVKIAEALGESYELSSPSAELTPDSDFDAVIFFGKQKTLGVTEQPTPLPELDSGASGSASPETAEDE